MQRRQHYIGDAKELQGRQADMEVGTWSLMRRITSPIR
jgi:hypothetical protein